MVIQPYPPPSLDTQIRTMIPDRNSLRSLRMTDGPQGAEIRETYVVIIGIDIGNPDVVWNPWDVRANRDQLAIGYLLTQPNAVTEIAPVAEVLKNGFAVWREVRASVATVSISGVIVQLLRRSIDEGGTPVPTRFRRPRSPRSPTPPSHRSPQWPIWKTIAR